MAYIPGNPWKSCDFCGFKRRSSEMAKTWDGFTVCSDTCFEVKHPSLVPHKLPVERIVVRDAKPEKDVFIEVNYVI
jgi:hypothetical protein